MRKLILYVLCFIFLFDGCNVAKSSSMDFEKGFHIGVIQTTQQKNLSYITYYDESLNTLGEQKIKYGDMCYSGHRAPIVCDDYTYTVPLGLGNERALKIAGQLNMKTGEYKTFDIKQNATYSFYADEKNIYTFTGINGSGIITKCSIATGKLQKWKESKVIINTIHSYDEKLYCWGTIFNDNVNMPYLFIFDIDQLKLIKKINIEPSGSMQYDSLKRGDYIYFTNSHDSSDRDNNILSKLNIKTYDVEDIVLENKSPNQIFEYEGKLIITHSNPILRKLKKGNEITIFDPDTQEEQLITLDSVLAQCSLYKDKLYSHDGEYLYIYDLKNNFKLIKKVKISIDRKSSMKFFIGGFFINQS